MRPRTLGPDVRLLAATLLASMLAATTLPAQQAMHAGSVRTLSESDSLAVLRRARRAQGSFEITRRGRLPVSNGSPSGRCDVRVGRFCYWHDDGEPPPKPEPKEIGRARGKLLAALDSAAADSPADEWIVGQRVRYHMENADARAALAAARACRSAPWWCAALAGFVLHQDSQPVAADSAYRIALERMSAEERCRWTDVSMLLEGKTAAAWKRAPCGDAERSAVRDSIASHLWWLSRPFFGRPTNDRYTEHLARRTMSRLESMATAGYDTRWGTDTEELLLRFGWPTAWSRHLPAYGSSASPSIIGHEPTPSFHFVPDDRALDVAPGSLRQDAWQPTLREASERYAPTYLKHVAPLRAQVGIFRRGADALVVARLDPPADSLLRDSLVSVLAISQGADESPVVTRRAGSAATLTATAPWRDALVSVELFAPRAAARLRVGTPMRAPTGRIHLSDLLFYDAVTSPVPATLDSALRVVLGDARTSSDRRVGVLWETYGLAPSGETVDVSLEVERVRVGWATRAAERLRLATAASPIRVRWAESPDRRSGGTFRALALDLSHLAAGHYEIRLRVNAADGATATAVRELEIVR